MRIGRICALTALAFAASITAADPAVVCRLNPYGDNFLSLRTGPGAGYEEIDRMGPNTVLAILSGRGAWLYVRTAYGLSGWAHSRYICG